MISSYGDQSATGIILHIIIKPSPTLPQLLWKCFQRHLMFYTCNYNIRVTHRNGAIKHIFTRIESTEGSSTQIVLYSFVAHALALHLAVKILLQIFLYEDLSTLTHSHICRLYFPPRYQQDRTLLHQ